jgi:hypothetical protein
MPRLAWLAVLMLCSVAPLDAALQSPGAAGDSKGSASSLVVVIPGDKQFHQPACPLVAKAGSRVKIMKRAEAEARGLTAHDCEKYAENGGKPSAAEANAVAVFVQPGDRRYHKAGCPRLGSHATKMTLEEAGRKYWPCPVCKPPIRQRDGGKQ